MVAQIAVGDGIILEVQWVIDIVENDSQFGAWTFVINSLTDMAAGSQIRK